MQSLGIRTAPKTVRYAVLDWNGSEAIFLNSDKENKIDFPAETISPEKKVIWLFKEFQGILLNYPDVERVAIKVNEYSPMGHESSSSRESAYLDGTILLASELCHKEIVMKSYSMMRTKRNEVKAFAEQKVRPSSKNWNEQMADAVVAAWSSGCT